MNRIAIVGSGSIGLYYGGKLAANDRDVSFLVRSGYDEARREGIRAFSPDSGDVHLRSPSVHRSSADIGPCDLVIVALKATSNGVLEEIIPPLLHGDTALVTFQNGLGNEDFLADRFGAGRVMGGLCFVCLTRSSPTVVNHMGRGTLSLGEHLRSPLPRTHALAAAFNAAGVETRVVEDLAGERWRKLVWNIPFNGLAVSEGGITVDRILADPALAAECRALMDETIEIANTLGHPIPATYADFQIERSLPMGPYQPSTLVDWLAGNELEIEPIWGEPLRRARAAGLPVPHLAALHEKLNSVRRRA